MEITFYSTHCPKCNILKQKMNKKNIKYLEVNDVEVIRNKGFTSVPMLEVNGEVMDFVQANSLINNILE